MQNLKTEHLRSLFRQSYSQMKLKGTERYTRTPIQNTLPLLDVR